LPFANITMADKTALRLIGFVAGSITCAVVLVAIMVVYKTVAGNLSLYDAPPAPYGGVYAITTRRS
jgi:hypothetical protein